MLRLRFLVVRKSGFRVSLLQVPYRQEACFHSTPIRAGDRYQRFRGNLAWARMNRAPVIHTVSLIRPHMRFQVSLLNYVKG